jgi:hypothetical protein
MAVWNPPADDCDPPVRTTVWSPDRFSDPTDRQVKLTSLVLERLRVAAAQSVTPQLLADADLELTADMLVGRLTYHLTTYLLAERLASHTESATDQIPASWWDHWKHDHPRVLDWSLRLFWAGPGLSRPRFGRTLTRWLWLRPPGYQTRTLTVTWTDWATYPQATIPLDDPTFGPLLGKPVAWRQSARDDTGSWPS